MLHKNGLMFLAAVFVGRIVTQQQVTLLCSLCLPFVSFSISY